jgi:hypothetical protein
MECHGNLVEQPAGADRLGQAADQGVRGGIAPRSMGGEN